MNLDKLVAIDTHVHAEVSCCQPPDLFGKAFDDAADKYFGTVLKQNRRPTIPETIALFRALGVRRGVITHLSHDVDHGPAAAQMPAGVELAYDGLELRVAL